LFSFFEKSGLHAHNPRRCTTDFLAGFAKAVARLKTQDQLPGAAGLIDIGIGSL
jgi:hypothetical protein